MTAWQHDRHMCKIKKYLFWHNDEKETKGVRTIEKTEGKMKQRKIAKKKMQGNCGPDVYGKF